MDARVQVHYVTDESAQGVFPLILTLDTHGVPHRWITWQHACYYYAKDQIAWSLGERAFTVYGGLNRVTALRSEISASSIIAIKGRAMAMKSFNQVPPLNNRELFHRDRQVCAYCGGLFAIGKLTRDHILPFSRGGRDSWMNVVTACRPCNERKSDRTPEGAGMELIYLPYVPNRAEYLILTNRRILADQMEFLAQHVPAQSRLHQK
ncbi:MAG TPA: HNH endonuclease [Burkholderiales bacterium]|jgi:Restriction endonuclease